jgi:hypothetical protein
MNDVQVQEVEDVYRLLCKGLGHERVTDDNVWALIRRAEQDGHTILATELREWQAPCGTGPSTLPPADVSRPPQAQR